MDWARGAARSASDLLAVLGPPLVGMSANRIPTFLKRLAGRRFSTWQDTETAVQAARREAVVDNR
ncbi:hypothetical protein AB0368_33345 [Actinoplanes sp. NPDC051475]|uniref:GP88 family protein n=1 Tax=Actinoplanes sp. NPDC051475 TaxID=3157225 RepID=UPI00344DED81